MTKKFGYEHAAIVKFAFESEKQFTRHFLKAIWKENPVFLACMSKPIHDYEKKKKQLIMMYDCIPWVYLGITDRFITYCWTIQCGNRFKCSSWSEIQYFSCPIFSFRVSFVPGWKWSDGIGTDSVSCVFLHKKILLNKVSMLRSEAVCSGSFGVASSRTVGAAGAL